MELPLICLDGRWCAGMKEHAWSEAGEDSAFFQCTRGGGGVMMRGGGCRNKDGESGWAGVSAPHCCRASQSLLLHFYQAADTQAEWQQQG